MRSLSLIVAAWLGVFVFADRTVPVLERQLEASRLEDIAQLEQPTLPEGAAVVVAGIDLPPPCSFGGPVLCRPCRDSDGFVAQTRGLRPALYCVIPFRILLGCLI